MLTASLILYSLASNLSIGLLLHKMPICVTTWSNLKPCSFVYCITKSNTRAILLHDIYVASSHGWWLILSAVCPLFVWLPPPLPSPTYRGNTSSARIGFVNVLLCCSQRKSWEETFSELSYVQHCGLSLSRINEDHKFFFLVPPSSFPLPRPRKRSQWDQKWGGGGGGGCTPCRAHLHFI